LKVYVFDGTTYTGYNKTIDASGQATFTLPEGDYRFRADKDGTQYWSSATNHCTVPGCTSTVVTTTVPVTVTVEDDGATRRQACRSMPSTLPPTPATTVRRTSPAR
jgi:hypothetical protein